MVENAIKYLLSFFNPGDSQGSRSYVSAAVLLLYAVALATGLLDQLTVEQQLAGGIALHSVTQVYIRAAVAKLTEVTSPTTDPDKAEA